MTSCVDAADADLELLPLELDDLPLWCEELCEDDDEEDALLPFLPLTLELELLRTFSGVLSRSSCCCCFEWLLLDDRPDVGSLRELATSL